MRISGQRTQKIAEKGEKWPKLIRKKVIYPLNPRNADKSDLSAKSAKNQNRKICEKASHIRKIKFPWKFQPIKFYTFKVVCMSFVCLFVSLSSLRGSISRFACCFCNCVVIVIQKFIVGPLHVSLVEVFFGALWTYDENLTVKSLLKSVLCLWTFRENRMSGQNSFLRNLGQKGLK